MRRLRPLACTADEIKYQLNTEPMLSHINIGTGKDITIKQLAETIKKIVGYDGVLKYDLSKPDGTERKLVDTSKLLKMGWNYHIELEEGLRTTYEWYKKSKDSLVIRR